MRKTSLSIFKKPRNIIFLLIGSILMFTLFRVIPVYQILSDFFSLPGLSAMRRFEVFSEYVFDSFLTATLSEKISTITLAVLTTMNLLLFALFTKRQRTMLSGKGFFATASGMILGLFGVGCISCGAFVLAPVITFIGLGTYMKYFIEYASIISYAGIILVLISNIYLLRKISKPMVCK
jgi:hypothetical protein